MQKRRGVAAEGRWKITKCAKKLRMCVTVYIYLATYVHKCVCLCACAAQKPRLGFRIIMPTLATCRQPGDRRSVSLLLKSHVEASFADHLCAVCVCVWNFWFALFLLLLFYFVFNLLPPFACALVICCLCYCFAYELFSKYNFRLS